jgi:hypothetical protein
MRRSDDYASRLCRVLFTLLMALAWCGAGHLAVAQAPSAQRAPPKAEDFLRAAEQFGHVCDALEAFGRELPRDTFDPKAVLGQAGPDPAALLVWVRDHTFWVPYRGALRGASGVLMDRVGNSLDRSLLLAELVRRGGRSVRLCRADLSAVQAAQLLTKIRPAPAKRLPDPPPANDPFGDQGSAKYAAAFNLDPVMLRENTRRAALESSRAAEDAAARIADQMPAIAEAIGPAARPDAPAPDDKKASSEAALADHWWVQFQDGGRWVDVDPMLPDAQVGTALAPPAEMIALDAAGNGKLPLQSRYCQELEVRVVVERWDGGGLFQDRVLVQTLRPAEVIGQRIALTHFLVDWPAEFNLVGEADPAAALKAVALKQHEWVPVVAVGDTQITQGSFSDAGRVNPNPNLGFLAGTGKSTGGAADAATGALDQVAPAPVAGGSVLTAEWVEYEIRVPGLPPETVRREIFDLLGASARSAGTAKVPAPTVNDNARMNRSLATLGTVEILPVPCRYSEAFVQDACIRNMSANRDAVTALLRDAAGADHKTLSQHLEKMKPASARLYGLARMRHEWNPSGDEVYLDRPNVLTYRQQLSVDETGRVLAREGYDIVTNGVAPLPGAPSDSFSLRLRQGVADGNVESILMTAASRSAPGRPTDSAADALAAGRSNGSKWLVLRSTDDAAWKSVHLPEPSRARVERDLKAGYAVLVSPDAPKGEGRGGGAWWRVNPRTGEALGMTGDGWGGATMVEYAHLLLRIGLAVYGAFACFEGVKNDTTVLKTAEQKQMGTYLCLAIAILGVLGIVQGFLASPALTFGGLIGTAGGMAGAAGTYYGRGGGF